MTFSNIAPDNDFYSLPIEDAKGCNTFLEILLTDDRFAYLVRSKDHPEMSEKFRTDIEAFNGYMNLTINSGIKEIEIPERYHQVFKTVTQVAIISMLFGA